MKSVAELKRDAKSGTLEARMLIRCGSDDIPERLQGWRKLVDSNTVSLFFLNNNGAKSALDLPKASLIEYDGETLTIYYAGYRDLTEDEQRVMDAWRKIKNTQEFKERSEYDALTDGMSTYYQELFFFRDAGYEYLMGGNKQRGMKYDFNSQKVQDESIRGAIFMRYEIRKVS